MQQMFWILDLKKITKKEKVKVLIAVLTVDNTVIPSDEKVIHCVNTY